MPRSKPHETSTVLYVRCSTKQQSFKAQKDMLLKFCKGKKWKVTEVYQEKRSGTNLNRPQLSKMLEDAVKGEISRVVIQDLSRLTRTGIGDTIRTIEHLMENNVELYSVSEGMALTSQFGTLVASIMSWLANAEQSIRTEKQRLGIEAARKANGGKCHWGGSKRKRDVERDKSIVILREQSEKKGKRLSVRKLAEQFKCSPATVQKAISDNN